MSLGDRDYMKASPDDEKRVADYEDGAREREYGDRSSRRRVSVIRLAVILAGGILLFVLVARLVSAAP